VAALTAAFSSQTAQVFSLGLSLGLDHVQVHRMAFRSSLTPTDMRAAKQIAVTKS
jgi:hypothetical protein